MKKIAMIYSSIHHNNTETLVKNVKGVDLYKINEISCIDLSAYDLVGFASGIYQGQFHKNIVHFIHQHAKELNHIFLVYTSGSGMKRYGKKFQEQLEKLGLNIVDIFSCKGFDPYGAWKLVGGIAKKHTNQKDLEQFKRFIEHLQVSSLSF